MKISLIIRATVISIFLFLPTLIALIISTRFTHTPWYYETARADPKLGLNFGWGSVNWMNIRTNPLYDFNITYQDVEFDGPYGSTLRGWFIPSSSNSSRAIIGVHGAGLDRREFLKLVPILHRSGYHILLFDCREHGISTGSLRGFSYGIREHADIIYAVKYMKTNYRIKKLGVVATSQGATSTILAASMEDNIDAVWLENPFAAVDELFTDVINGILDTQPEWSQEEVDPVTSLFVTIGGYVPTWFRAYLKFVVLTKLSWTAGETGIINAVDAISKLHQPIVLIHGTSDSLIPIRHTLKLFETAHEPKTLWIADGCEHAAIYNKYPLEYADRLVSFFHDSL